MRLRVDVDTLPTVSSRGLSLALSAREKAHAKHGPNSIEGTHDAPTMLAILVEEVGEVAHTMTYDGPSEDLLAELAQVMAVAWAWLDGIERER